MASAIVKSQLDKLKKDLLDYLEPKDVLPLLDMYPPDVEKIQAIVAKPNRVLTFREIYETKFTSVEPLRDALEATGNRPLVNAFNAKLGPRSGPSPASSPSTSFNQLQSAANRQLALDLSKISDPTTKAKKVMQAVFYRYKQLDPNDFAVSLNLRGFCKARIFSYLLLGTKQCAKRLEKLTTANLLRTNFILKQMASGMTIPHYKLHYFPVRGRGEPIRYLFWAADVPYEEAYVNPQEWPTVKPSFKPFTGLPVLEIDGKERIGQHVTICRYLAKRFGLAGKDALEQAKIDMFADGANDLYTTLAEGGSGGPLGQFRNALFSGGDTSEGKEAICKWCETVLNPWLDIYTTVLEKNGSGWIVGDRLSYADLYIGEFLTRIQMWNPDAIKHHLRIQQWLDKIHSVPGIAKRVNARPAAWPPL